MRRYLISTAAVLLVPLATFAQIGMPPFSSFTQTGLATTNNQDLNGIIAIPVVSSPGRGLPLDFGIVYNSQVWRPYNNTWGQYGGWLNSLTGSVFELVTTNTGYCDRQGDLTYYTYLNGYQYQDTLGALHPFNLSVTETYNSCTDQTTYSGTYSGYATDNSGYYALIANPAVSTTPTITTKSGVLISTTGFGKITDPNGNFISGGTGGVWTDSAGRATLKIVSSSSSIQYEVLDPTGAYQTTTVNLTSTPVKTNFGCSGLIEYSGTQNLPTSIQLPNGQTYTITYEPTPGYSGYVTGRVKRITLPTGGYYEYDYIGSNDGTSCSDGSAVDVNEIVSDGTNTATWTFVRNSGTTTITTPQLADTPNAFDTVYTFTGTQASQEKIYKESPGVNVLRTINTTWASNKTPATQVTILEDGSTQSEVDTTYDSNGLLDSISEYDWGSGGHGSLIRTTTYTYQTSTNYTSRNILDLVTSKQVKDASGTVQYRQDTSYDDFAVTCHTGITQHDDTNYPCSMNYRGNPTTVTTYLQPATPTGGVSKTFTYDVFGNLLTAQVNCCQNKTWVYSTATNYSEPDSVTSGTSPSLTTQATYNSYTGQVATSTDPNNLVTHFSYDTLRRPTQVWQTYGGNNVGSAISYTYDDNHFTSTTNATIDSSKSVQQIVTLDGLARPNLTTTEDINSNVYSKVSTVYDLLGRAYQTSNPYTGSSGSYWTTTQFDVLGRPVKITLPDSSATNYSYSTNTTTITDPAGVQRKSVTDGVGRLSSVYEPDPTNNNSLTLLTSYTHNVLDELTQISQGSQTRSYVYDALGRLNKATTPERGTVCYGQISGGVCGNGYDSFGNLLYRTDARGVVTNYIYDSLNRLLGIAYPTVPSGVAAMPNVCETTGSGSNNANVCFTYGTSAASYNDGRLAAINDPSGSESYTYNNLGKLTQLQKVIGTTTYTTGYVYNLADELTQITYPSGRVVQQSVDAIGQLCAIAATSSGCTSYTTPYATGFAYSTAGQPTGFKYGNGVYASFGFSPDRLQLTCLDYSTTNRSSCAHDGTTKFGLTYSYGSAGNNNGQIASITDAVDNGRTITYTYDALYRMTKAVSTGSSGYPAWGLSETYDRYGNRTAQSVVSGCTGITCPTNSVTVSAATNQITGSPYTYDASGDVTNDAMNTLTYDGEGRAVTISGSLGSGTYTYDGNGLRVKKVSGSNSTAYIFSGSKVIAEYVNGAAPNSPTREYVYAGGVLLASIDSTGTKYFHQDHLSNRIVTNSSGSVVEQLGHFPFGESWYNGSAEKWFFTTYERDSESGNDYAMARYQISRLSRFSSPDPLSGLMADPQSLNRYTYATDDPANLTDPSGADDCPDGHICVPTWWPLPPDPNPGGGGAGGQPGPQPCMMLAPARPIANVPPCGWGPGGGGSRGGGQSGGTQNSGPLCGTVLNCNTIATPPAPPRWKDCLSAIRENPDEPYSPGLLNVTNSWGALEAAGNAHGVDPALLASIGLQESDFNASAIQRNGQGVGAFQIDLGQNPGVTITEAQDVAWSANWAAQNIAHSYALYVGRYGPALATLGAIRNYNGSGGVPTSILLNTGYAPYLNIGTNPPLQNYVGSVLNILANCFH